MKKLLLSIFLIFLVGLSLASAALTATVSNPTYPGTQTSAKPGDSVTYEVTVSNNVASQVTATLTSSDLVLGANKISVPSTTSATVAAAVGSSSGTGKGTISVVTPTVLKGTYTGTITATDASNSAIKGTVSYSMEVSEVRSLDVEQSAVKINTFEGQTKTTEITLKNKGTVILSNFEVSHTLSTDGSSVIFDAGNEDKIVLEFKVDDKELSALTLNPGESKILKIKTIADEGFDLGTRTGALTIKSKVQGTTTEVLDSATFDLEITPELCEVGPVGSKLVLDIKEPDRGEDFKPGDTINVEVNVENKDSEDRDVEMEISIWNLDENDELLSKDVDVNVDSNSDEDIEVDFVLPYGEEIGSSDKIVIFAMATFDDTDFEETTQCAEASNPIDVDRENHEVLIREFVANPTTLTCGDNVNFRVSVLNIGKKEEDNVQIQVRSPDLFGVNDLQSNEFTLKKFDKSDNAAVKTFSFRVPDSIKEGTYNTEAIVLFDSKSKSDVETQTLTIGACGTDVTPTGAKAAVSLLQKTFAATEGKVFAVPVTLQNSGSESVEYTVEANAIGGWGTTESEDVSVAPGQASTVFVYVTPKTDLEDGKYAGNVVLRQNGNVVATETFSVDVGATTPTGSAVFQQSTTSGSFFRNWVESGRIFWVLGIVILLVLIIFFARLIFAKE
ncbi:putative S-layer protein [Candidatus Woesearchaeota archaeon]|nr:putative S-layer protein [Candidatus Woesearchaeota archaeon]